jgi:hypothetical protein
VEVNPVTVSAKGAGALAVDVVTVIVVDPEFETVGGVNAALAPAGNPLTTKLTAELKPFKFATDTT